jgi:hypothetical protein
MQSAQHYFNTNINIAFSFIIPRSYFLSDFVVKIMKGFQETLELINKLQAVCMLRYKQSSYRYNTHKIQKTYFYSLLIIDNESREKR